MSINGNALAEMEVPESYLEALPKVWFPTWTEFDIFVWLIQLGWKVNVIDQIHYKFSKETLIDS